MTVHPITVHRCSSVAELGALAGARAAEVIADAIQARGRARVILAAAPSQSATLDALAGSDLDFTKVEFFHMDDYLGLGADAPQGFGNWLERHFISALPTGTTFHRIDATVEPEHSAAGYAAIMGEAAFDLTLCGLGVNGHLAFNDPPADFSDPLAARLVDLDLVSRQQQVDEGHFDDLDAVPAQAITVTIPRLLNAAHVVCSVPGAVKRQAVADTLAHDPDPLYPGTALKMHPDVHLYLDPQSDPDSGPDLGAEYFTAVTKLMARIRDEERAPVQRAAELLAEQIRADRLVHVYGPGGHSNLASQEIFFRAGGLMHISAMLDEGTLISSGALRSMAIERTPGYGRIVVDNYRLGPDDLLILVNAYGINSALIDAALRARELGVTLIGVSSRSHAERTAPDHPARHPSKANLHDLVDVHLDTKVPIGDAVITVEGALEPSGATSTFANAYTLNWLVLETLQLLAGSGVEVPMWRSGNAPGGDQANARFIDRFAGRVKWL